MVRKIKADILGKCLINYLREFYSCIDNILIVHMLCAKIILSFFFFSRKGTIYQPLRSGRIWHKVNF